MAVKSLSAAQLQNTSAADIQKMINADKAKLMQHTKVGGKSSGQNKTTAAGADKSRRATQKEMISLFGALTSKKSGSTPTTQADTQNSLFNFNTSNNPTDQSMLGYSKLIGQGLSLLT